MSDRRRFLKGLTSLPLATVLANLRLAAAVSAGLIFPPWSVQFGGELLQR